MKIRRFIRNVSIFFTILITFSILSPKVEAANHFDLLLDKNIGHELEKKFILEDQRYLESKLDREVIRGEIKLLEKNLEALGKEAITTKNGFKIYGGNIGIKNNIIRTAIQNRKAYLQENEKFKYDSKNKYIIDRGYNKEDRVKRRFDQKDMDLSLESVIEVLDNLEINSDFLKDTTFVISPYVIDGINGYTVSRNTGLSTVVISNQITMGPKEWVKRNIKSTTLHELGHVYFNNNRQLISKKDSILKYEQENNDKAVKSDPNSLEAWRHCPSENFAEDFRIYNSKRLGEKSFKPSKKKTALGYEAKEFEHIMEKLGRS